MRKLCATLVLSLCATLASAEPFEDGLAAARQGDYAAALKLWRPLAEQGDTRAQGVLGLMYDNGQGVPRDDAQAIKWYRAAADQGLAQAQYNLGVMYEDGRGVTKDAAEAMKWYRLAADQRDAQAQYSLGLLYAKGEGVPRDYVEAHKWWSLAAAGATVAEARDMAARNRDLVAAKMTSEQIAKAQKLAREWKPAAK